MMKKMIKCKGISIKEPAWVVGYIQSVSGNFILISKEIKLKSDNEISVIMNTTCCESIGKKDANNIEIFINDILVNNITGALGKVNIINKKTIIESIKYTSVIDRNPSWNEWSIVSNEFDPLNYRNVISDDELKIK